MDIWTFAWRFGMGGCSHFFGTASREWDDSPGWLENRWKTAATVSGSSRARWCAASPRHTWTLANGVECWACPLDKLWSFFWKMIHELVRLPGYFQLLVWHLTSAFNWAAQNKQLMFFRWWWYRYPTTCMFFVGVSSMEWETLPVTGRILRHWSSSRYNILWPNLLWVSSQFSFLRNVFLIGSMPMFEKTHPQLWWNKSFFLLVSLHAWSGFLVRFQVMVKSQFPFLRVKSQFLLVESPWNISCWIQHDFHHAGNLYSWSISINFPRNSGSSRAGPAKCRLRSGVSRLWRSHASALGSTAGAFGGGSRDGL